MWKLSKPRLIFGAPFKCGATSRMLRWCEAPESVMRRVGFSDEICRGIDHGGWYLSEDNCAGETARGVVFRLTGKRGFVAGLATSYDSNGAALAVCEAPESTAEDAARYADQLAEWYAEAEREYQEAYGAGQQAREALREAMGEACDHVSAARTMRHAARKAVTLALSARSGEDMGFLAPGAAESYRRMFRQALESSRDKVTAACEIRREAWRAWHNARPGRRMDYDVSPYRAGWHDGAADA